MLDQEDLDASKFSFGGEGRDNPEAPSTHLRLWGGTELSWEEWSLEPGTPEEDHRRLQGTVTFWVRVRVKALPPL